MYIRHKGKDGGVASQKVEKFIMAKTPGLIKINPDDLRGLKNVEFYDSSTEKRVKIVGKKREIITLLQPGDGVVIVRGGGIFSYFLGKTPFVFGFYPEYLGNKVITLLPILLTADNVVSRGGGSIDVDGTLASALGIKSIEMVLPEILVKPSLLCGQRWYEPDDWHACFTDKFFFLSEALEEARSVVKKLEEMSSKV